MVFKVSAAYTSQACAKCDYTHPENQKTQSVFHCIHCGHRDNADQNAAHVIKKRAIRLLKYSGTELVGNGIPLLSATGLPSSIPCPSTRKGTHCNDASKKINKRQASVAVAQ